MNEGPVKLPLWKTVAEQMIEEGISYGQTWPVEFFAERLREAPDSARFGRAMCSLRQHIERKTGYYMAQRENGKLFTVPLGANHEEVADMFGRKVKSYAFRHVHMLDSTLRNPAAQLSDAQRERMLGKSERAAIRLALITKTVTIAKVIHKHAPKLLTS